MPNLQISCDEQWPTYYLDMVTEKSMITADIPEDLYKEYLYTMYKYNDIQIKLKEYFQTAPFAGKDSPSEVTLKDVKFWGDKLKSE